MGKFTIRHTFDCSADTFWEKIFKNDEFNKDLYLRHLKFNGYDILRSDEDADGTLHRKVRTEPKADAPAAVRKVLGDSLSYIEEGVFDPKAKRYRYTITPSTLADKTSIKGDFWVEPQGDARCERLCDIDLAVKIFGVGRIVEGFIEKTTRDSYDEAAKFTQQWIRENL
jgi:hypothetical protein